MFSLSPEAGSSVYRVLELLYGGHARVWCTRVVHAHAGPGHTPDVDRRVVPPCTSDFVLPDNCRYVRKLRGELRAARNEEARRTATKEAAEADIAEMRALIRDAELAASNVRRLGTVVGKLTAEWEAKLKVGGHSRRCCPPFSACDSSFVSVCGHNSFNLVLCPLLL